MTEEENRILRTKIESLIEELKRSVEYLTGESRAVEPSVALGRLTRMDAINEKSVNEEMLAGAKNRLERLQNAFERIEKGAYGMCIRCGQEIPYGRLSVLPEVLLCVPCAERKTSR